MFVLPSTVTVLLALTLVSHAVVLVDFQVAQPPPLPADAQQCTVPILQCVPNAHQMRSVYTHRPLITGVRLLFPSEGAQNPVSRPPLSNS